MGNYEESFVKPETVDWDKKIPQILALIHKKYSLVQIEHELKLKPKSVKVALSLKRKDPKWAGQIPYLAFTPREIQKDPELKNKQRIGVIDIEFNASKQHDRGNFDAIVGYILCYVIEDFDSPKQYGNKILVSDLDKGLYDKTLVKQLAKDIKRYDFLVGYFHEKCDIPFCRTRCIFHKLDFPEYNTIRTKDLYDIVKHKLMLGRNSLSEACKLHGIKGKTHIDWQNWTDAVVCRGKRQRDAINMIFEHCKRDVHNCTKALAKKILKFSANTNKPI